MVLFLLCSSIYHLQKYYVPSFVELSTLPYAVKEKKSFPEFTLDFTASHGFGHWQDQAFGRIMSLTISKAV